MFRKLCKIACRLCSLCLNVPAFSWLCTLHPPFPPPSTAVACRMLVVLRQCFAYFAADYHLFSGRSSFHKQLIMLKRILALTARVASTRLCGHSLWQPACLPACLPPSLPSLTLDLPCIFRLFGDLFGFNFVECRNAAYNKRKLLTDLECQHTHCHCHTQLWQALNESIRHSRLADSSHKSEIPASSRQFATSMCYSILK